MPTLRPRTEFDIGFLYLEALGEKGAECGVGLAVNGGGAQPDFQSLAVQAGKLIPAGAGLNMAEQQQRIVLPAVKRRHGNLQADHQCGVQADGCAHMPQQDFDHVNQ